MKPPPLLLAAALLFWGWQTDLFKVSLLMAIILESARLTKARWEFSDDDFARLWTFCTLVFLGTAVYAFTANEGPSRFMSFLEEPTASNTNSAGNASALAAAAFFRWMPMTFFLFVAAQTYSTREEIPLNTIDLIMRIRWKRDKRLGRPLPPPHGVNVSFPYFAICLFSASIHDPTANNFYFIGLCVLLVCALLALPVRRFGYGFRVLVLALALALGYVGQYSIIQLSGYFGRVNPQWFSHFLHRRKDASQSRTSIGRIGQLKLSGSIVIRLDPQVGPPPEYLRETTYRAYQQPVWFAGKNKEDFDPIAPDSNTSTWRLLTSKTNAYSVQIGCYLAGGMDLLPLPVDCGELQELQAYSMRKTFAGGVRVDGPGLVVFNALYGPGPVIDGPPDESDRDIPANEQAALSEALAQIKFGSTNIGSRLFAINRFFQDNFTYSTYQERTRQRLATNETSLGRFLLQNRRGHCEYFATAAALLLRKLEVPTRYAVGYAVHEKSGSGYVVRLRDAHAWCLVWNGQNWQNFDPTPASWVREEEKHRSTFERLSDLWDWCKYQFTKFRWGQTHLRTYLLITLVPVLLLLLGQIFFRQRRRRAGKSSDTVDFPVDWPGLDSEFYLVEKKLAARGVPRLPNEPLTDWLERATRDPSLVSLRDPLRSLLRLHYRCRFDPAGMSSAERQVLREEARASLDALGK
ncbi:MAG: transglutaminase domain-containing protein [Verrucomicrobiota bacterium]